MKIYSLIATIQHEIQDSIIHTFSAINLRIRAEKFIQQFDHYLSAHSTILDIGSGSGPSYVPLKKRGHEVILADVKHFNSCPFPVVLYDGKKLPFKNNSVDSCLLLTVLHHTQEPLAVIQEAMRVCRKNTIIVEGVYHTRLGEFLTKARDVFLNFEYFGHPFNFKSHHEWLNTFSKLGYNEVESRQIFLRFLGIPSFTGIYVLHKNDQ